MKLSIHRTARAALRVAGLAAALAGAACGGGDQATTFSAQRVIALGDESSVVTAEGKKYSVNAFANDSTSALDCRNSPIWVQTVAVRYGLAFPQCPGVPAAAVPSTSRIRAAAGATVADLAAQIDAQIADGGIGTGDLVTLLVGANDVIAQFAQIPAIGEAQVLANLDAAGAALSAQANRLAALDARVLISTIPDIGRTPFAGDRSAAAAATNPNPVLLSRLSTRFNDAMLSTLLNDGRKIGLIQLDQYLIAVDRAAGLGQGSFVNVTQGSCAVALPDCTPATLLTGAGANAWLWADDRHLGAGGQNSLGSLAVSRATTNPF